MIPDEAVEAVHSMEWVCVADGTADAQVCAVCGVVRGGFVVAGAWPCEKAEQK